MAIMANMVKRIRYIVQKGSSHMLVVGIFISDFLSLSRFTVGMYTPVCVYNMWKMYRNARHNQHPYSTVIQIQIVKGICWTQIVFTI